MIRQIMIAVAVAALSVAAFAQSDKKDDSFDVRSSVGDLHVGKDADAKKAGLPLYPGALPKVDKKNDPLNVGILTDAFGLKLVVAKYESPDSPEQVAAFYRHKMKKYGKVLECHSQHHAGDVSVNSDSEKSGESHELKCDQDSGPVTELKVGSEDNQHIVAIEPGEASKGSSFALVYLYKRDKKGDI